MGTTVVLALFRNDRVYVAGIGDSRAYRLRDGQLEQLTKDHSLADALLEAGHDHRRGAAEPQVQERPLPLPREQGRPRAAPRTSASSTSGPGDRFLLASDGLTGVVRDDELAQDPRHVRRPPAGREALMDQALDNDSKDNVTCLVIHVVVASPGRRA